MPIKTQQDVELKLDLTPMIDVVFLLIIFFMVATKFSEIERSLDMDIPQVKHTGNTLLEDSKRTVVIQKNGLVLLDGVEVSVDDLHQQLSEAAKQIPNLSVTIRCDGKQAFENFAAVLGACKTSGISRLDVAVRPGETSVH